MLHVQAQRGLALCDRLSRRAMLQIGGLGTLGLSLPNLLAGQAKATSNPQTSAQAGLPTFGRAKRVILLFMWGGPAHQDLWDLKPHGPSATRGEFLPIATCVPGMHISEHLPLLAQQADKLAILRSVGQEDSNHSTGAHAGLTGRRHLVKAENFGPQRTDFPHYGSVLSKLAPSQRGLPTFVSLPDLIATTNGTVTPGQNGGLLGSPYDPFRIDAHPDQDDFSINSLKLPAEISSLRMGSRRSLLDQFEDTRRLVDHSANVASMSRLYDKALGMVLSQEVGQAFDLASVPERDRWRYGWHTFGQSVLMAKRLIEAGVKLVTVYWHREKVGVDSSWDTHWCNFPELKNRLMPSVDRPIAALLQDLAASGLLDETLIVWNSEFGRTPNINANGGRDHWGPCNSVVMAGGGVPGGQVFGATDAQAAFPMRDKVTQDDISATIYHLLGIDGHTEIHDELNRPFALSLGTPIHALLGNRCQPEATPAPALREALPQLGPFGRMLKIRGGRHLLCEMGHPHSEAEWELTNWSDVTGQDLTLARTLGAAPGLLRLKGVYNLSLAWERIAIRSATARRCEGLKIVANGQELPIPAAWRTESPRELWQIPLLPQVVSGSSLTISVEAPGWAITAVAFLGDAIHPRHLALLDPNNPLGELTI